MRLSSGGSRGQCFRQRPQQVSWDGPMNELHKEQEGGQLHPLPSTGMRPCSLDQIQAPEPVPEGGCQGDGLCALVRETSFPDLRGPSSPLHYCCRFPRRAFVFRSPSVQSLSYSLYPALETCFEKPAELHLTPSQCTKYKVHSMLSPCHISSDLPTLS